MPDQPLEPPAINPDGQSPDLDLADVLEEDEAPPADAATYRVLDDPLVYPVIALGVALTTALPVFLGQRLCLPLLNALVIFPFLVGALRTGRLRRGLRLAAFWAICQAAAALLASLFLSARADFAILNALELRTQLYTLVATGQLQPGFVVGVPLDLPRLLLQALAVAGGSLATAGLAGLVLDAATINATSYAAASLLREAGRPLPALLLAWPLWTVLRLAGYLALGAALAEPLAAGDPEGIGLAGWWQRRRRLIAVGAGLVLLGILLQLLLTSAWADLLRRLLGW
ncbi:MAG: hypothetical protein NZ528_11175 [Caldilineales bacterium]|nr:hypothetical protein [Caldilineales bacterium]MDW8318580.1 hypothetical protein [Anaerolineae bacterium]